MTGVPRDALAREAVPAYPREPLPLDRSILWYPAARGSRETGARGGYSVFVEQSTINAIRAHVESAPEQSLMGFLAGELFVCSNIEVTYLVVDGVFVCRYPIEGDDPMPVVARVWERLENELGRMGTRLVGWYRSCPRGDVMMNPRDVAMHEAHFPEPWQIAILTRPDRARPAGGIYRMVPGSSWPTTPLSFYELMAAAPRRATGGKRTRLTWKNYHTNELVLAADERGVRPEDDEPAAPEPAPTPPPPAVAATPVPAPRDDAVDESKRPTLQVVRTTVPVAPPRRTTRAAARRTVPTMPRPEVATEEQLELAPEEAPVVQTVGGRRQRRRGAVLAAVVVVALAALGAITLLGPGPEPQVAVDAQAARVARLDRVSDTLGPALRNYGEREALFREGLLACEGLARGYAAVDTLWSAYRNVRRGLTAPLDAPRESRDARFTAQVDAMRREFARGGCVAP
jgi:hypothetical protein